MPTSMSKYQAGPFTVTLEPGDLWRVQAKSKLIDIECRVRVPAYDEESDVVEIALERAQAALKEALSATVVRREDAAG